MKVNFKSKQGITLVALIITIIVLLILAMVSISLVINSGIITKTKTAVDKYSEEEIAEQLKLAYAEHQMSRFTDNPEEFNNLIKTKLEATYGEGNVDIIDGSSGTIVKINKNGETIFYEYDPSSGTTKEIQKGIKYGNKSASEIEVGDDITIGTEKFKVFSVDDTQIKAMPYYNITLTDSPMQSSSAGTIAFSTDMYWSNPTEEINMSNEINNIQTYINNYATTLQDFGAGNIQVRVLKNSDRVTEDYDANLNPAQVQCFWMGSMNNDTDGCLNIVENNGTVYFWEFYTDDKQGVRPIIVITK